MTDCIERMLRIVSAALPVGTSVLYYPISGEPECLVTRTRSEPWALGHGAIVVKVEGIAGGVAVDHLEVC